MFGRRLTAFLGALVVAANVAASDDMPDPRSWFMNDYAPLWSGDMTANIEALKHIYAAEILNHDADGAVTRDSQQDWLIEPMQGWLADGWLGATLLEVTVQVINPSTVTFAALWRDHYEGGETEMSCGWYLADAMDGAWIITEYADMSCADSVSESI